LARPQDHQKPLILSGRILLVISGLCLFGWQNTRERPPIWRFASVARGSGRAHRVSFLEWKLASKSYADEEIGMGTRGIRLGNKFAMGRTILPPALRGRPAIGRNCLRTVCCERSRSGAGSGGGTQDSQFENSLAAKAAGTVRQVIHRMAGQAT